MQLHPHINSDTIRYQPDKPHENTEPVEVLFGFRRTFIIGLYSPYGMDKHQYDGKHACNGVYFVMQIREVGYMFH